MDILDFLEKNNILLIAHPAGVDSASLCTVFSEYISKEYNDVYIITWDDINTKKILNVDDTTKIVNYETFVTNIRYKRDCIFIFDNLNNLLPLVEDLKSILFYNKIIILFTLGVYKDNILALEYVYPKATVVFAKFCDYGFSILFELFESNMSPEQTVSYLEVSLEEAELEKNKLQEDDFLELNKKEVNIQTRCNIFFPENQGSNQLSKIMKNNNILINKNMFNPLELKNYSSKFPQLLQFIILNKDKRHFIFTRFKNEYGLQFLSGLFKSNGFNVYVMEKEDEYKSMLNTIDRFNEDIQAPRIFLTNSILKTPNVPLQINHLHMIDGSLRNTLHFIDKLYKYKNYITTKTAEPNILEAPKLTVNNYVAFTFNNKITIDAIEYQKEEKILEEQLEYYSSMSNNLKHIVLQGTQFKIQI